MPEFRWDAGWDFIAVVLSVLFGLFAVLTWWLGRTKKGLTWRRVSNIPLLSVGELIKGRIKILLDGQPVENVHHVELEVINSGRAEIREGDFDRPLRINFGHKAKILSFQSASTPENLRPTWKIGQNEIMLEPLLLNRGDEFTLIALVSQLECIAVDYRVAGVKEVKEVASVPHGWYQRRRLTYMWVLIAVGSATAAWVNEPLGIIVMLAMFVAESLFHGPYIAWKDARQKRLKSLVK